MALLIFLMLTVACAWPCSLENTFEAATYVKTEKELNEKLARVTPRNLPAYFHFLEDLPTTVSHTSQPSAEISYPESCRISLDPSLAEPRLSIPLIVSAQQRAHSRWKTELDTVCDGKYTHTHEHTVRTGCDGIAQYSATVVLKASFNLTSRQLRWEPTVIENERYSGACLEYLNAIKYFNVHDTIDTLQRRMLTSWNRHDRQPRHVLHLPFGSRLFFEFQTPRISLQPDRVPTISGSILACAQDDAAGLFAVSEFQQALRKQCHERESFTMHESVKGEPVTLDSIRSLVFSFRGDSHVRVAVMEATVEIEEHAGSVEASLRVHDHGPSSTPTPFWLPWVPSFFRRFVPDSRHPDVRFQGNAQGQYFWLQMDGLQEISLGRGTAPGKQILLQKTMRASRQPLSEVSLSSDSKTIWKVSTGKLERICGHSMPATLSHGNGNVHMSAQLFEAVLGVQSRHLTGHASMASTAVRDARLNYSFEMGGIQLTEVPHNPTGHDDSFVLTMEGSNTTARCDGRAEPLLAASLDHFQGAVTVKGKKGVTGSLSVWVALSIRDRLTVRGLHLKHPSVPVSQSAETAVMARFVPDVNQRLQDLALTLPEWLAQYIPCKLHEGHGSCENIELGSAQHDRGFVVFSGDVEASETSFVAPPSSLSLTHWCYWYRLVFRCYELHPKLATVLLLLVSLALLLARRQWSPMCAVSALVLSILSLSWSQYGPFKGFTASALSALGTPQTTGVKFVAEQFQDRTDCAVLVILVEMMILPWWADICAFIWRGFKKADLKESHKEAIAHWCFSAAVVLAQFWLLVGMPMMLFLGRELAAVVDDYAETSFPSSPMHLIEDLFNVRQAQIHHTTGALLGCSFTAMVVSLIGLYFVFFLSALPPGAFLGILTFRYKRGAGSCCPNVTATAATIPPTMPTTPTASTATLCILIIELLSNAAILGPLVIAYQILGGTAEWWLAWGIMGICRPLFAVPYIGSDMISLPILPMGFAYLGCSLLPAVLLWMSSNNALAALGISGAEASLGQLSSCFICSMYMANVWFVASSAYMLLYDTAYAKKAAQVLAAQIKLATSHPEWAFDSKWAKWIMKVFTTSSRAFSGISEQTWSAWWESFFPWLVWFLEMDAVVSFFYHLIKVIQLGVQSSFFNAEMSGHMLLVKWFLTSNEVFDRDLREVPKVVLSGASFSWCGFAVLLSICLLAGWVTLHYAHAGRGPARRQRTLDMCTMRARCCMEWLMAPFSDGTSNDEAHRSLLSDCEGKEDEECRQAIANYVRLCSVDWKRAETEVRRSWAGIAGWLHVECEETWGEYRQEFLLFGLLHGLLGYVRTLMWRDSFPHAWGLLQSRVAMQVGLQEFHAYLAKHGFQAGGSRTVLDDPFLAYDWCLSLSLVLQSLLWILILASLYCEFKSRKPTSQAFSFAAGAVAVMSGLCVLVPNYAKMTNLTESFRGCGPEFDRLMEFAVSGTLGMTFAVPLGLQIFGVLLTVPISAVRGLWFVTIRPEMRKKRALHTGMWLVAFLIPFVTIFPLLFFSQLTEDSQSQAIIYVFWLLPSLRIISAGKTRGETWFYFGWLTLYCFLVGCFLGRQSWIMSLDVQSVIDHLDGPWLWSMMHADFCLTNVIITDLVCFVLGDMEEDEDLQAELELSKACMAVSKTPFGVTGEMESLPGFQSARVADGLSILDFGSEAEARAASSRNLADGRLVSLSSLVSVATSH